MIHLHFVGNEFYSINAFEKEAERVGFVSRRISLQSFKKINFGDVVFLFQGNHSGSVLFGYFMVTKIFGKFPPSVLAKLNTKKVTASGETITRKCGTYVVNSMYVIENSIPEIAQIIKECGEDCGELMIGGEYQKHEEIKSNIPHQQGFRGFDYDEFIEEVRRVDNPRIRIKGMFYSEKKGVENITEAIAFQLESYVKGKGK